MKATFDELLFVSVKVCRISPATVVDPVKSNSSAGLEHLMEEKKRRENSDNFNFCPKISDFQCWPLTFPIGTSLKRS